MSEEHGTHEIDPNAVREGTTAPIRQITLKLPGGTVQCEPTPTSLQIQLTRIEGLLNDLINDQQAERAIYAERGRENEELRAELVRRSKATAKFLAALEAWGLSEPHYLPAQIQRALYVFHQEAPDA